LRPRVLFLVKRDPKDASQKPVFVLTGLYKRMRS